MAVLTQARVQHSTAFRLRKLRGQVLFWFVLSLFIIFACFPVYWMFLTTFKQVNDLYNLQNNPLLFQLAPTLDQVQYLFERTNFSTWVLNTGEVGLAVVVITVVICVPAAYVLARSQFPGSGSLGMGIFLTYLVPPTLLFLPLSQLVVGFGLVNDKWSLALVYPTFTIPFCTWLLMGFFKNVPREITEAARVDGCSRLGAMFRIVLPLSVPGILTICIFAFTLAMQEYVYALTFVSSSDQKMITLGVVTDLIRGDVFFWGSLMAGALIVSIPVAIVYNLFMDTFVRGITGGALK
ncbi:MAG: carbohydrate ABC transporter permease [Chloroflexi bacterium]|nr:MAG: carbohydrate ABC transporter permease [Chloroflexota bacterium]TMG72160.1 MAG: carbohydrate ABC transporter permease [Chloroflexota bacterium]